MAILRDAGCLQLGHLHLAELVGGPNSHNRSLHNDHPICSSLGDARRESSSPYGTMHDRDDERIYQVKSDRSSQQGFVCHELHGAVISGALAEREAAEVIALTI